MKEQVLVLAKMQAYDDKIGDKLAQKEFLPKQLEALETAVEDAKNSVNEIHASIEEILVKQKAKDLETQANKDLIAKYAVQLNNIKTNKEYKALNKEIEALNGKNSEIETEILTLMDEVNTKKEEMKEAQAEQKKAEAELKSQEVELKKKIGDLDHDIKALKDKRNELTKNLPITLTRRYIVLLKNKGRKAVVYNFKGACSGLKID
jgi:predicted  nucleic acid-binding Zn-ribbon protein